LNDVAVDCTDVAHAARTAPLGRVGRRSGTGSTVHAAHAAHAARAAHTAESEVAAAAVEFVPAVRVAQPVTPDAVPVIVSAGVDFAVAVFDAVEQGMAAVVAGAAVAAGTAAAAEGPSHSRNWPQAGRRRRGREASQAAMARRSLHSPQTCLRHWVLRCRQLGPCPCSWLECPYLVFLNGPCAFAWQSEVTRRDRCAFRCCPADSRQRTTGVP
jgi:hypothetical protein